jgi:hypothetical protein
MAKARFNGGGRCAIRQMEVVSGKRGASAGANQVYLLAKLHNWCGALAADLLKGITSGPNNPESSPHSLSSTCLSKGIFLFNPLADRTEKFEPFSATQIRQIVLKMALNERPTRALDL